MPTRRWLGGFVQWSFRLMLMTAFVFAIFFTPSIGNAAGGGGSGGDVSSGGEALHFPDPALERLVRGQIVDAGDVLYAKDVLHIESLYAEWPDERNQIHSLAGIEALVHLDRLILKGHHIEDLSPLAGLSELTYIDLRANAIGDLTPLAGLGRLESLYAPDNDIGHLPDMSALVNLRYVDLGNNRLTAVSPLAALPQLSGLAVHGNALTDIAPLEGMVDLWELSLYGNPDLDLCAGTEGRRIVDGLMAAGSQVVYEERFPGEPCADKADAAPIYIKKHVAGAEETIAVRSDAMVRVLPDGGRIVVSCSAPIPIVRFFNTDAGVGWDGLISDFSLEMTQFIALHLLPEDPAVRLAVNVRVEEVGADTVAGYQARHYQVDWRPNDHEGGGDVPWQPLQELWIAPELTGDLGATDCGQVITLLEMLQLLQGSFSVQRFYGLADSMEYNQLLFAGFPVRVKLYDLDGREAGIFEVSDVTHGSLPTDVFDIPDGLEIVDSPVEVF